jgi:hypothetical protein
MPKTKHVPTRREFQYDVPFCWGGGRCPDIFVSKDGHKNYLCSNCVRGFALKERQQEQMKRRPKV